MYFKIVFLLLILSSITNSENASNDSTLGDLKSTDPEKASGIEEGELTNEDNSTTTMALPPAFEVEVQTLPSPPETPTKPDESKESEQTPDDKQKPNPDPKPEDKKEENKEDAKPGSNDPPKDSTTEESKKPNETTEKPNEKKEPETPAPKQPEKASRTGLKKGSVWGIAIGVIGMVATTGFLVVYILKRRRGDDRLIR
uniref:Syndecan/Neurexin domain-containing protein n=1 Tax=Tetranychus urticae TaxID=32264 RepID=T1KMT5_TETUR